MKKGLYAIFAIALLGIGAVSAFGFANNDNHEAIQSAIESGDYNAWKEAHIAELTEDNFNAEVERYNNMTQMHDLMDQLRDARQAGDDDLVASLQSQLEDLRPEGFNGMRGEFNGKRGGPQDSDRSYGHMEDCPYMN